MNKESSINRKNKLAALFRKGNRSEAVNKLIDLRNEYPELKNELILISILTPSYNSSKFIEETIQSVINQTYFFIDPPYTVAGKRLYTHFDIDHESLFSMTSQIKGKFMLTYDNTIEIRRLADQYNLLYRTVPMKTTHHIEKSEVIISDNFDWWKD